MIRLTIREQPSYATAGLLPSIKKMFLDFPTDADKELVADYLQACIKQENIAVKTKRVYIVALVYLCRYLEKNNNNNKKKKSFKDITAKDLAAYLNSFQKSQDDDPDQSWISTQRTMAVCYMKFFKWLAYPDLVPQERKRLPHDNLPPVLRGVVLQTKKGSKSPVKAKDIWNDQDSAVFLRYCADNPRLRFYHALAIETSGRPSELLQLKIEDLNNIETDTTSGKMYTALDIGRYGKRKQSRIVGITDFTIQYYQAYLPHHPDPANRGAFLFLSKEHSAFSRNVPISVDGLGQDYKGFRDKTIPKLLKRSDLDIDDKKRLQLLRDEKRWNPYTMRHSSITKLARDPNINDYTLRQHCGWSKSSNMVEIYTHDLKGDSLEHVMMAYGINIKDKRGGKNAQQLREQLVGPHCPFCKMANVPNTQFCSNCHRSLNVISYDGIMRDSENTKKALQDATRALAELRAKQEESAKSQQLDIDEIKTQMAQNHENTRKNLNSWMWDFVTKINEQKQKQQKQE